MNTGLSLADQITLELRADIIGGCLLPGMALVENDLVSAYNASRNTIREALHRLGQEGLTRYVRNKGVMVRRLGGDDVRDLSRSAAPWSFKRSLPASHWACIDPTECWKRSRRPSWPESVKIGVR